jgi:uncharacterized phiE125 gp8 family phage protein
MPLQQLVAPTVEPLTLDQAKRHLRETLVDTDNDADITDLIVAARQAAEARLERTLLQTTWLLSVDAFPDAIELTLPPIIAVESVKYLDSNGVLQTLDPADYTVDLTRQLGYIVPAYGKTWPDTRWQINAVQVRYRAGYGTDAASVPRPIVQWCKLVLSDLYNRRDRSADRPAVPQGFADDLLAGYAVIRV